MLTLKKLGHLRYTIKHKWYVLLEAQRLGITRRGLMHDMSKFSPIEFDAYAEYYFDRWGRRLDKRNGYTDPSLAEKMRAALEHHIEHNPHHHQHHVEDGVPMPMSLDDIKEMVADMRGASRAQGKGRDIRAYYNANKDRMLLHPETRKILEFLIEYT